MSFIHNDPLVAATAINIANEVDKANSKLISKINSDNSMSLQGNVNRLQQENTELQSQLIYYKSLLCKPMQEIAEKNGNFKKTYEKQMEIMADWMVSQKAFKELAIEFGFDDGLQPEEVIQMGKEKKIDVINNNNNPLHKTNSDDFIAKYHSKINNNKSV